MVSLERAILATEYCREHETRALEDEARSELFRHLCMVRRVHVGENELIVGERGPAPGVVPLFPEQADSEGNFASIPDNVFETDAGEPDAFEQQVIPYWRDVLSQDGFAVRSNHDRISFGDDFDMLCRKGILARKAVIAKNMGAEGPDQDRQLRAMDTACNGIMIFAVRHAELADSMADAMEQEQDDLDRVAQLRHMADVCRRVPAHAPCDFWEALQMLWFLHLGAQMESAQSVPLPKDALLNYLTPFYERDTKKGGMPREFARELVACFLIKAYTHGMLDLPENADSELAQLMSEVAKELHLEKQGVY